MLRLLHGIDIQTARYLYLIMDIVVKYYVKPLEESIMIRLVEQVKRYLSSRSVICHYLIKKNGNGPHHSLIYSLKCRRSEEHTSELQSRFDLVCRFLV